MVRMAIIIYIWITQVILHYAHTFEISVIQIPSLYSRNGINRMNLLNKVFLVVQFNLNHANLNHATDMSMGGHI